MHILLIADQPDDITRIQALLGQAGEEPCSFELAGTPSAGLSRIDSGGIELVIVMLPPRGHDGLQMLEALRCAELGLPVLAMTDREDDALAHAALERGVQECVAKSDLDRSALWSRIRRAVVRHRAAHLASGGQERSRELVTSFPDGLAILQAGALVFLNPACVALMGGQEPEAIVGKSLLEFLHPHDRPQVEDWLRQAEVAGRRMPWKEAQLIRMDGAPMDVEMAAGMISDRGRPAVQLVMRDVTERKRADRLRDDFVNTIAHEVQTPLSSTHEGLQRILDEGCGPVTAGQRQILTAVTAHLDRLARIVSDLVDIAKLEAGAVEARRDRVDLAELLRVAAQHIGPKAAQKGLALRVDVPDSPVEIYADAEQLHQVLSNLLSNALKFTSEGAISIALRERDHDLECLIADTGCGIPKADLATLFDRFRQFGRRAGDDSQGVGLGLAISKRLIELHRGVIRVESEAGAGTRVTITLPKPTGQAFFGAALKRELASAAQHDGHVSVMAVSIRNGVSDASDATATQAVHGMAGEFEHLLKEMLRHTGDVVAQDVGGVVILVTGCDRADAQRLRARLSDTLGQYLVRKGSGSQFSVQVGCATYPEDGKTEQELRDRARQESRGRPV